MWLSFKVHEVSVVLQRAVALELANVFGLRHASMDV